MAEIGWNEGAINVNAEVMVMGFSILIQGRQDRISEIEKVFDIFHSMSLHFVDISTANKLTTLSTLYSKLLL